MTDSDSQAVCFRMLEELMQDTDVVMEPKRHNVKQSCGAGVLSVVSPASSLDEGLGSPDDVALANGSAKASSVGSVDDGGSSTDEASEVSGVVVTRRGSPVSCCCGDNRGFNVRDNQRDDMTGIVVANGGRFPCLHIGLTGLRHNRRYFLALDFVEVSGGDGTLLYCYTEPYYTPRPNNLPGLQWMGSVLYFNLNSIANGGLQEGGATLKVGGEYEPTLRLMELRDDQWPSGSSAVRFPLRGTAFLVVSLSSEVRMNRTALASEFLLVRKSEMSRSRFPAQQQQQQPQLPPPQQQECCRTSPTARSFLEPAPMTPTTPQSDWRRLLELRVGSHQAAAAAVAAAAASRLMRAGPPPHGLQALPSVSDPLSVGGGNAPSSMRPVYASAKSVMHDHFTGGVWKSLPPQPQPSHHQPTPQQQQPPVGSWHSSARQPHSCLAPGAHLEALLHQNRETFSSLVHQSSVSQPRPPMSDFSGGRGGLLAPEPRPSLPPFGASSTSSAAAAAHALQECWSRGGAPSAAPPLFRLNYDLLPSGCLHWLALARNSVVRPQPVASSALDHVQQLQQHQHQQQQQAKQDMGVQTSTTNTTTTSGSGTNCPMVPCLDDAELAVNDQCISSNAASSSSLSHGGSAFYASTAAASTP
ncbi:uncharacterized protein LOC119383593 isoform X2 [Rhipicephalus sanguineus]|uniref:uncharacterized protein LOC119383593 isoform X2 n=1 Tax=Rhipicephalus sanguineus TaxID=34632 RepID=UPI001895F10E|nr:uncharacterized protein LOC119383593 isoform X2 [Rhipicephalus sanguineus]